MRGQPDFGMYAPKTVGASLADLGDLAVRLGSIVEYDRRGDIVCLDDFEATILKWSADPWVGTEYARLDSTSVKSGSQAVRLHTPDTAFASITISKGVPILGSKRLGFEVSFSRLSTNLDLFLEIYYYTGTRRLFAAVQLDNSTRKLYVYNAGGAYEEVADTGLLFDRSFLFFTFKLVVDFDTLKYVRLLFNINEYDISSISLYTRSSIGAPYVITHITLSNKDADGGDVWLDNFILTQAEP